MSTVASNLAATKPGVQLTDVATIVAVNADGTPIAGGSSSGIGTPADAAWTGSGPGTVISILKANYALLAQIRDNTATS